MNVGAYDGVRNSNTVALERCYGWTGVRAGGSRADPKLFSAPTTNANWESHSLCVLGRSYMQYTIAFE